MTTPHDNGPRTWGALQVRTSSTTEVRAMTTANNSLASTTRDGYQEAQRTARDFQCAEMACGAPLVVKWDGARYVARCGRLPDEHEAIRGYQQTQADEIRERLERDPRTAQALAISGASTPLTTAALRSLTDEQLKTRIKTRFGDAFGPLHGQIMALAKTYGLDPVWDIMIYEERPYIQYEGRLRKLREAPGYRGHKVRPVGREEKALWDYDERDIVVECDVDMGAHGHVVDYGVVYWTERARANERTPVFKQPQLIAIKRAVGRASRVAVGIDLPTWDRFTGPVIDVQAVPNTADAAGGVPALPPDPDAAARGRFWAVARGAAPDGLGLNEGQVHRLLDVQTLKDYPGGWDQALSDLYQRHYDQDMEPDEAPLAAAGSTSAAPADSPRRPTAAAAPSATPPAVGSLAPLETVVSSDASSDGTAARQTTAECALCRTVQPCTENGEWHGALVCVDVAACAQRQRSDIDATPVDDQAYVAQTLLALRERVSQHDLALVPASRASIKGARAAMLQAAAGDVDLAAQLLEAMTGKPRPEDLTEGQAETIMEAAGRPGGWLPFIAALRRVRGL